MHQRTIIRQAAVAALLYQTAAGLRVVPSRMQPWRRGDLPAIAVYCNDEKSAEANESPRELERHVDMTVEVALLADDSIDEKADALAEEVERAFDLDRRLSGAAGDTTLTDTKLILIDEGERLIAVIELSYDVLYRTFAVQFPTVDPSEDPLPDFKTAATSTSLGNAVSPGNQAQDKVVFP